MARLRGQPALNPIKRPYILQFDDPEAGQVELVGGKAASLARLTRAGLPVPPGFCLTTAACDEHLRANGLTEPVIPPATLRIRITAAPMPPGLAGAIRDACRRLGRGAWAIRSSAVAEDQAGASFAGQHETLLNVLGEDAVLAAIQRCWASLWTERAIAYREHKGLASASLRMAVVVQRLVPAEAAGVMFTADPLTGDQDRIVIEASFGLGEALVAGRVTPDRYVVDKETLNIRDRFVGEKEVLIRPAPAGGTLEEAVHPARRATPALPDHLIAGLAALGRRVETLYDRPQDIEWALYQGQLYLLQSRPVTSLPLPSRPA